MGCCQCQGIEDLFSEKYTSWELSRYRKKGPGKTTCMMIDALKEEGIQGLSLLDIGGGVGAIEHELLNAGVQNAIDVDASHAYIQAAREEAQRRGMADRVNFRHGNFVDLAAQIPLADIVTLDRVLCCYPDMQNLVSLSAAHARKLYCLVYPRDVWWVKIGAAVMNLIFQLRKSPFRFFPHPTREVEALINRYGLRRCYYRKTAIWQVAVYSH